MYKLLVKTKLLEGKYVEIRGYELHKYPLKVIHCENPDYQHCNHETCQFMLLTLAKQNKGKFVNKQQSKFPPYSYYDIYKFLWKPSPIQLNLDEKPTSLNNVMLQMARSKEWEKLRKTLHEPKKALDK